MTTKTKPKKRAPSWSQQFDDIAALSILPDERMLLFAKIVDEADEYRRKQEERQNAKRHR